MSHHLWAATMLAVALLAVAGCQSRGKPAAKTAAGPSCGIVVLFDISGSTSAPAIRQRYYNDLHDKILYTSDQGGKTVPALAGGEVIMGDVITHNTLATASFPINQSFPVYNTWRTNPLQHSQAIKRATDQVCEQAKHLVLDSCPSSKTDLMNAFQLADKVFNGSRCGKSRSKILVVFSDMIEQSPRYDFSGERLTERRAEDIIQQERNAGRLPQLQGVKVWVAGATASARGGLSPQRIHDIQAFWIRYFKACGADLTGDRYAATLINFELPSHSE